MRSRSSTKGSRLHLGRRKDALDAAVQQIGRNVTGVQGDSADLDDLDRLFETVKQEKGSIDVLWTSAGAGVPGRLGEITEEQFDAAFAQRARHAVHGPEGAAAVQRWRLDLHDRVERLAPGYPEWSVYAASKAVLPAYARVWVAELRDRRIRVNVLTPARSPRR
ncbi:SDR family NAD(P)-dependent oxidoreductase [Oerskovia sp. M15]